MMARVRDIFDPQGLFNPGKIFDPKRFPTSNAAE
jgi:FAD/FMN-containing dehydrogenase